MLCQFCFAEGHVPKLSKEHLLSKPVAKAFRLDRSGTFGHVGDLKNPIILTRLGDTSVRFVCEPCNNTWIIRSSTRWHGSMGGSILPISH